MIYTGLCLVGKFANIVTFVLNWQGR